MARVSKAVSCQSAVMRTTPLNDPSVKRRRSEAGDWGKECLQIGRQFGNSSGDGDSAGEDLGASAHQTALMAQANLGLLSKHQASGIGAKRCVKSTDSP